MLGREDFQPVAAVALGGGLHQGPAQAVAPRRGLGAGVGDHPAQGIEQEQVVQALFVAFPGQQAGQVARV